MIDLVPNDKTHEDNELMVTYARRVFTIAQMAGRAMAGVIDPSFLSQVKFCIRSFDGMRNPVPHNRFSYTISEQRADFYEYVIDSAKCFGDEMVDAVAKEFLSFFSEGSCQADADSRRTVALSLYRVGYDRDWCIEQLGKLDLTMLHCQDVDGRERESLKQGQAWLEVGCYDRDCLEMLIFS